MTKNKSQDKNKLEPRPPIVVILGHVDHGKTSILDYIRQSKVVQNESGGITQHIGAYQITLPPAEAKLSRGQEAEGSRAETDEILLPPRRDQGDFATRGRKITFIDTPGHEAFSAMRSRGAKVADIAILVVAADEGVKPQTKEAIKHILRLELPLLVAINKMDKPAALPEKVKKELSENNILAESIGGKVPTVLVSAKTGLGINDLIEMILLIAEMEELKTDNTKSAHGIIIESRLDPQRGPIATLLVQDGVLNKKDFVATESAYGLIKSMENFLGASIDKAEPSTPVLVTGLSQVPPVGEEWQTMGSLEEAKAKAEIKAEKEKRKREPAEILDIAPNQKVFNLVLKADVSGSLEAVREALQSIPQQEVILRVIKAEVGDITENDVKLADSAKARIYGFRVKCQGDVGLLAERSSIKISLWQIIYELIQAVRQDASYLLAPEICREKIGRLKVLAIFKTEGKKQIIGGRVTSGKIEKGVQAEVLRGEQNLGSGRIVQLQQKKEDVSEVIKDRECGILFESDVKIEKNDILEAYKEERKKREL